MSKVLLATALLATAAYLGWQHFSKVPPPPAPPSVEEKTASILSRGSCTSNELADLLDLNPSFVSKKLKGRILKVTGILSRALPSGVHSSDLILELRGNSNRDIDFMSDFQKFTRLSDGIGRGNFKFQKFGYDIVLVRKSLKPIVLFREGDQVTLTGMFQHVGKHSVAFQLRETPIVRQ